MNCCHTKQTHTHTHNTHGHGMGHGDASSYLKRFWIVTVLLVPLTLLHPTVTQVLALPDIAINTWIQFGIATLIFGFSLVFFKHAWHEIQSRQYGMMTLVSLATGAGYTFSVASTFISSLHAEFYLEISTLIWILLFGHYLEAKSSSAAGNALQEVTKLLPQKALTQVEGKEVEVEVSDLKEHDTVIVKPGQKIPADGVITKGSAHIDESLISGESKPIRKEEGDSVVAGSLCIDGSLLITLTRVGEHSTVGQIYTLIEKAGKTKPHSQKIADKASAILTFIAGITALTTLLIWTLVVGETFVFAITLAITVLVIACPHALGLAIPTVTTIATSLAVKHGFFIKDLSKIEHIKKVDYVIFDKTGTLTEGVFGVTGVTSMSTKDEDEILRIAASLEQGSSHIIGQSILSHARSKNISLAQIEHFKNKSGRGVEATIDGVVYAIGNEKLMNELNHSTPDTITETVVFVADKEELLGYITLADAIKESSSQAIENLHSMGIHVAMLTGDNEHVAKKVSTQLDIDLYFANVLPEDKYTHIKKLQDQGNIVLMVGDGVNDAPALTQADIGVAIGAGTDVAVEAGDVVLMNNNPADVARLISLSKKVYVKMIQNLVWALGYNIIAIPAAAGVFALWGFFLRPEIGALFMSLSTVIVVINAMTLKRITL